MARTKAHPSDRQLSTQKATAILKGAMEEFLAQGYAATSMDRVAAVAGVSKATVYSHFQDKEGLFKFLIQQLAQKRNIFRLEKLRSAPGEPRVALKRLATEMLDRVREDPQIFTFMRLIIGESGRFPELARTFVQHVEKPTIEHLTQYLEECPDLKVADPEVAARAFIGTLIHYVLIGEVLHGRDLLPMDRVRLINNLVDLIVVPSS